MGRNPESPWIGAWQAGKESKRDFPTLLARQAGFFYFPETVGEWPKTKGN
jgi:hypothetical protein